MVINDNHTTMWSRLNINRLMNRDKFIRWCQRRYNHKRSKHSSQVPKSSTHFALEHFDKYHKPVYGDQWPSIRVALLSQQKYCALVNNFANPDEAALDLMGEGAEDIIRLSREASPSEDETGCLSPTPHRADNSGPLSSPLPRDETSGSSSPRDVSDLQDFMPVRRIGSEMEQLKLQEAQQNLYQSDQSESYVTVVPNDRSHIPLHLRAFSFESGDVRLFGRPTVQDESKKLNYYALDGASLLPVIALDLYPGCRVLDLCSAPGGKTLAMLQTLLPDHVTCVDNSPARIKRLRQVLQQYVPTPYVSDGNVDILKTDGVRFCHDLPVSQQYDRVLVDAPCFTDRHYLFEEEGNLFAPSKLPIRIEVPKLQERLLLSGLKACRPGGHVVYSTCTLSPTQNEGVIRAALERVWQETNMEVVVKDTSDITHRFRDIFTFYDDYRLGTLVLPHLTANYGPMYYCKLERVR